MSEKSFVETTILPLLVAGIVVMACFFGHRAEAASLCGNCHDGKTGTDFPIGHIAVGSPGSDRFLRVKSIVSDSKNNAFLDSVHLSNSVMCRECHGDTIELFDEVANDICFGCHGNYQELAGLTENQAMEDMNPHNSHLGELDCTVCHHAHEVSIPYCLQCHLEFTMPIPAGQR